MLAPSSVSSWLLFTGSFRAMFSSTVQFYGGVLLTWTQEPEGCKMAKWYFLPSLRELQNHKTLLWGRAGKWVRLVF